MAFFFPPTARERAPRLHLPASRERSFSRAPSPGFPVGASLHLATARRSSALAGGSPDVAALAGVAAAGAAAADFPPSAAACLPVTHRGAQEHGAGSDVTEGMQPELA